MKFNYSSDTDSLYIDLAERPASDSQEVAAGVVEDFDSEGHIVGIDIEDASKIVNLSRFESESLPFTKVAFSAA